MTRRTRPTVSHAAHVEAASAREFKLARALLVYEDNRDAYVSAHDVRTDDHGRPHIGAGVPLTRSALGRLASALGAAATVAGFVPERVVYTGPGVVAWWVAAQWRRIWFDCRKPPAGDQPEQEGGGRPGAEALGQRSGEVPHPPLVFVATGRGWYVRALPDNARPRADTPLMVAPYFNVYDDGGICTGNVKLPRSVGADTLAEWEDAFFRSRFTHPNARRLADWPGGAYALWADLLDGLEGHLQHPCRRLPPLHWCENLKHQTPRGIHRCHGVAPPPDQFPDYALIDAKQTLAQWIAAVKGEV